MIAAAYGPVSDVEIIWVVVAFVGLIYSLLNVQDSLGDRKFLDDNRITNGRRALAKYQLMAEILRAGMQLIFFAIGVAAMTLPEIHNSADLPTHELVIRVLLTYGLVASSIMLTIKSYLGFRVRNILTKGTP